MIDSRPHGQFDVCDDLAWGDLACRGNRCRRDAPPGTAHLALDDAEWTVALPEGQHVCEWSGLRRPGCMSRLKRDCTRTRHSPGRGHGRFLPALYVEVERTGRSSADR